MPLPLDFFQAVKAGFPEDFLSVDAPVLKTYGGDWTRDFLPCPSAVAFPRTTEEVARLLRLCQQHRVAVVPSGGRTGLAGGTVACRGELVVNLERMRRMEPVDEAGQTVRVQAGAVTAAVQQHCHGSGLTWPIRFAAEGSSQIGGNLATNAGGVHVVRYGSTRHWVLGLEVVTMGGEILRLGGALEKDNTGYDLRQLFIGSEGTLGIITEATLKLTRLPEACQVALLALESMEEVIALFAAASRKAPLTLRAFEVMDRGSLEVSEAMTGLRRPCGGDAAYFVLLEGEGADREALEQWLASLPEKGLVRDGVLAQSPRQAGELWALRENISEALARRAFLHKNDVSVPIARLTAFTREALAALREIHGDWEVFVFGHVGDGNLHINVAQPSGMDREGFLAACHRADARLFAVVRDHGGSISAEHGIGLLKKPFLSYRRSEAEITLMKRIKAVFDPDGLLNPGKIF